MVSIAVAEVTLLLNATEAALKVQVLSDKPGHGPEAGSGMVPVKPLDPVKVKVAVAKEPGEETGTGDGLDDTPKVGAGLTVAAKFPVELE
jgi:hypothetical protein